MKYIKKAFKFMNNAIKNIIVVIFKILFALLIALTCVVVCGRITEKFTVEKVYGTSMEPTYIEDEYVITSDINVTYERCDIIHAEHDGKDVIKRLIGFPGEHVQMINGYVYIDGELLKEDYLQYRDTSNYDIMLQEDEYFILGDNRPVSKDSRYYGAINSSNIKGKIIAKININNKKPVIEIGGEIVYE